MRSALRIYIPIILLVIAAFAIAFWYVDPAPPTKIRMATGAPGDVDTVFGERYRELLAEQGIEVELVASAGALDNIALLNDSEAGVDVAFVQGGALVDPDDYPDLESLGAIYREPVWLFLRGDQPFQGVEDLSGRRIAVGLPGSGTRVFAEEILSANGLSSDSFTLVDLGGEGAAEALLAGDIDAAFFVTGSIGALPMVRRLATTPGIWLAHWERAEAYVRIYEGISMVALPRGALDLASDTPPRTVKMIAAVANLVVKSDLHPALAQLLLQAAIKTHGRRGLFEAAGEFPSAEYVEFPISAAAARFYAYGPSFLQRYLSFWAADFVSRLWVLLVPLFAVLIPLSRLGPSVFTWQVRRRVYRWYRHLRRIQAAGREESDPERLGKLLDKLEALSEQVMRVSVPLSYATELYNLCLHIDFVHSRLEILKRRKEEEKALIPGPT